MSTRIITAPTAEPISTAEAKTHLNIASAFTSDDTLIAGLVTAAREHVEAVSGHTLVLTTLELRLDDFPAGDRVKLPGGPLRSIVSVKYLDKDSVSTTWAASGYFADTHEHPGYLLLDYDSDWPSDFTALPKNAVRIQYRVGYAIPITAATTDIITATGHPYADADIDRVWTSAGTLPTGLSADTDYHIRDSVAGTTFKVAASAGAIAVDITGAGSGANFIGEIPQRYIHAMKLLISHWYENREAVVAGTISKEIELAFNSLVGIDRRMEF